MKKFMVISVIDGEQVALFFDSHVDARQHAMDVECGMGGIAQIYQLNEEAKEYEFLEE